MSEHKPPSSAADNDLIAPASIVLNAAPNVQSEKPSTWQQHKGVILGLGLSLILIMLVVFVLPQLISPRLPTPTTTESTTPVKPIGPTESPWQDAQFAKERRETQELLAKLLDRQNTLEEMQVERWANDTYQAVTASAQQADELYRQQEFIEAQQLYTESLAQFDTLIENSEQVYQSALESGEQALQTGDADTAQSHFETALAIEPQSDEAQRGLERTAVLEKVLAAIQQGRQAERNNDLDTARQHYQTAVSLDAESQTANELLSAVKGSIKERDFSKHMSLGFAAMSNNNFNQAAAQFKQALAIKPGASDAKSALVQAQNQNTQISIQQLIANAEQSESQENWSDALENYEQALKLDGNIVAARVGKIRTNARADIDSRLTDILAQPERLNTPAVHREFEAFKQEAGKMPAPREKLVNQLARLDTALAKAIEPVTLGINSDNATVVTLHRVGELGKFTEKKITLQPGSYTLVGTRKGYRDVREEIAVSAQNPNPTITVVCTEKISNG